MDYLGKIKRKSNPIEKSGYFSQLFFLYTLELFRKGNKSDLDENDLYAVPSFLKSSKLGDKLEKEWQELQMKRSKPSILRLLLKCHGIHYFLLGLCQLIVKTTLIVFRSFVVGRFVSFFAPGQTNITKKDAILYGSTFFLCVFLESVYLQWYMFQLLLLEVRVRVALCSLIYRKSLKLSTSLVSEMTIGKIVTLITKDVYNLETFIGEANKIWIGVFQVAIIFYMMYVRIGFVAFIPMLIFGIILPIHIFIAFKTIAIKTKMFQETDKRLQLTKDALLGIRTVKMFTWENFFITKLCNFRKNEILQTCKILLFSLITSMNNYYISHTTFFAWIAIIKALGNIIKIEIIYYMFNTYIALAFILNSMVSTGISQATQAVATVRRIDFFLAIEELSPLRKKSGKNINVSLNNVSVTVKSQPILRNLNLNLDSGLTLITGAVGSGKTTLLKTILGECDLTHGTVEINGKMSYASQEPWIFPSTIKQNILFGERFNEQRYNQVLSVCDLIYDFRKLQNGDQTIIESQGLNLSKGQRVRLNLARAVYKESDIYLLDDSLSALDVHVRDYIFEECIKKFLRNKLVLFVTQNTTFLDQAENLIVLSKGEVTAINKQVCGTTDEISSGPLLIDEEKSTLDVDDSEEAELLPDTLEKNLYEEFKQRGEVSYGVYRRWMRFGGGFSCFVFAVCFAIFPIFGVKYFDKLLMTWVKNEGMITNYARSNDSYQLEIRELWQEQKKLVTIYIVLAVVSLALVLISQAVFTLFFKKASIKLHKVLIEVVTNGKLDFFEKHYIGNILNRFSKDLINIDEVLPVVVYDFFRLLCITFSSLYLIVSTEKLLLVPTGVLLAMMYFYRNIYLSAARNLKRLECSTKSPIVGHFSATVNGLSTIRAKGFENRLRNEYDFHQDLYTSASFTSLCIQLSFSLGVKLICVVFSAIVMGQFFITDTDTGSAGVAILQVISVINVMNLVTIKWALIENYMTSVERVLEYLRIKQESPQGVRLEIWPKVGEIQYQNVHVSHDNLNIPILKNLNFKIRPKEKIGIVGRTGAGKSSLISTLFRMYDFEGTILVNGVDIKTLCLKFLRSNISVIPQDPLIFKGTLRENMDPLGEHTEFEIWNALETVDLKNLVVDLDVDVGGDDSTFSVGQKQLLCLARVLLKNKEILVVDEATANVDRETEILICDVIRKKFGECTVLMVSHNLETLLQCDKIMVLDDGEIIEFDAPESLIENKEGLFYKMVQKNQKNITH